MNSSRAKNSDLHLVHLASRTAWKRKQENLIKAVLNQKPRSSSKHKSSLLFSRAIYAMSLLYEAEVSHPVCKINKMFAVANT